jgi:hypothetical protein
LGYREVFTCHFKIKAAKVTTTLAGKRVSQECPDVKAELEISCGELFCEGDQTLPHGKFGQFGDTEQLKLLHDGQSLVFYRLRAIGTVRSLLNGFGRIF